VEDNLNETLLSTLSYFFDIRSASAFKGQSVASGSPVWSRVDSCE